MRNAFSDELYMLAKKNKKIYIVAADISPAGSMEKFTIYPDRDYQCGCS